MTLLKRYQSFEIPELPYDPDPELPYKVLLSGWTNQAINTWLAENIQGKWGVVYSVGLQFQDMVIFERATDAMARRGMVGAGVGVTGHQQLVPSYPY